MHLFSVLGQKTCFCLAREVADKKDGHNTVGLFKAAEDRADKVPAELVSDGLEFHEQAHGAGPLRGRPIRNKDILGEARRRTQ